MASAAPELALARDEAFERLYRSYVKDVYHYALALLRNPADAEDVTQTTFMNAYRAYKRGEEPIKAQNWLIKIAHNAARSRYARASRRVKEVPLEDHLEQLALPEDEMPDLRAVLEALGRLPLNQRAALVMRELEGRTYAEIADTLGVSVSAVETLIFRARRALRVKASALRVLTAVPLPTSLAQLFETGGGVVVGGSAVIGSGFLLKAAAAIVAGVVATGVGGTRLRPADPTGRPLVQGMSGSGNATGPLGPARPGPAGGAQWAAGSVRSADVLGGVGTASQRRFVATEDGNAVSSPASTRGQAPPDHSDQAAHQPGPAPSLEPPPPPVSQAPVSPAPISEAPAEQAGGAVDNIGSVVPAPPPVALPDLPPPPPVQLPAPLPLPQLP